MNKPQEDPLANLLPLTRKYFGPYILRLIKAVQENPVEVRSLAVLHNPEPLERRLQRLVPLGVIEPILAEIGGTNEAYALNERLMNAWAELRAIDQFRKEKFGPFQKVIEAADFMTEKDAVRCAVQVRRISTSIASRVNKMNKRLPEGERRLGSIYGRLQDIFYSFDEPLSEYFWSAIDEKNAKFRGRENLGKRCVVIVSSDEALSDNIVRKRACRQIRTAIDYLREHGDLNFEELLWLPDLSNGAWFTIDPKTGHVRCFVDWCDDLTNPWWLREDVCTRKELDLDDDFAD